MRMRKKINDDEASALVTRNMKAECNRKLNQLTIRMQKLQSEYSMVLATTEKYKTSCSRLQQGKKTYVMRIKELIS